MPAMPMPKMYAYSKSFFARYYRPENAVFLDTPITELGFTGIGVGVTCNNVVGSSGLGALEDGFSWSRTM